MPPVKKPHPHDDDETENGRERNPVYAVFELRTLIEGGPLTPIEAPADGTVVELQETTADPIDAWVLIASEVQAPSDKEAIALATAGRPAEERRGTFWAPLQRYVRPRKRDVEARYEDVWS